MIKGKISAPVLLDCRRLLATTTCYHVKRPSWVVLALRGSARVSLARSPAVSFAAHTFCSCAVTRGAFRKSSFLGFIPQEFVLGLYSARVRSWALFRCLYMQPLGTNYAML